MSSIQFVLIHATKTLMPTSETAALDAEVLLGLTLNKDRAFLRAWPENALTDEQLATFEAYIAQRQQGTPLAYITGHREFWSREFAVNAHVLIPRHDTELVIELCLKRIPHHTSLKVIDLGTGSGIIAITLAAERPKLEVFACDKSHEALEMAKINAKTHNVSRIKFYESDWFEGIPDNRYDFIISNPPYIDVNDEHIHQGDLRFEPQSALVSSKQGLHDIEQIINAALKQLNPQGHLIIEHGYNQKSAVNALFQQLGYQHIETFLDLSGQPRVTCGQVPSTQTETTDHSSNMPSNAAEINIPRKLMQQLLHAAQATPDLEVCGLIGGIDHAPTICYPIKNVSPHPKTRFQLDTKQQIATIKHMRTQGETLFGIYHSHPTAPAIPSKTDVQLASYPDALHFIISLDTKGILALRCFKIDHALTQEIALTITD